MRGANSARKVRQVSPLHLCLMAQLLLLLSVFDCNVATAQSDVGQAVVERPLLVTHVVQNLQQSVSFYHEGLGLTVISPPATVTSSVLLLKARMASPQASAVAATLELPGASFNLQLIQFNGLDGKSYRPHIYDPGTTRLSISVRDIYKVFNRIRALGATVDTITAGPVFPQRPRTNAQAVVTNDPDGFAVELIQSDNSARPGPGDASVRTVPATSDVYNARSSYVVDDIDTSMTFYRLLGFTFMPPPKRADADAADSVLMLEGTPRAMSSGRASLPPGSNNVWFMWSFQNITRVNRSPDVQDPGAAVVSFRVRALPLFMRKLQAARVRVETPGAAWVTLQDHHRAALIRSPDGLLIQLVD